MMNTDSKVTQRAALRRLRLLQKLDSRHPWITLDQRLHCALCEQTLSGHTIRIIRGRAGQARLACPTSGCAGTPTEWVHSGNPLVSEEAWSDWNRMLSALCDDLRPRPLLRRFRPTGAATGPSLDMAARPSSHSRP